jgi:glycosyltransferase involved in cell wall biosynthesis
LRYFHLYHELSRTFDVTLLSPTYSHHAFEVVEHHPHFREYRVPKEPAVHDALHMQLDQQDIGREVSALVCALSAKTPNKYHEVYLELYDKCDLIIHEFPYMLDYDLFFGIDRKPRIYNSHNFESKLVEQIWPGKDAAPYVAYIREMEEKLVKQCDLVFVTSEEEKRGFVEAFRVNEGKIHLAPNGVIPGQVERSAVGRTEGLSAFFIGSSHLPNIEAVQFLIENVADKCPDVEFLIAGSCCDAFEEANKKNARLLGRIDDKEKNRLLATCDIAVNPMFSGAGTNLKTLEYLAAGIPLVSTSFGVRGLGLDKDNHYIEADEDNFADTLNALVGSKKTLDAIAAAGKEKVSRDFSWKTIADRIAQGIGHLLSRPQTPKKSITLLNDFEASPGSSGGEVRLKRLYSALSLEYSILLVCLNGDGEIRKTKITDSFYEISIPKTEQHKREEQKISSAFWVSADDIVASMMVSRNELLKTVVTRACKQSDLVLLIHPYMYPLVRDLQGKPLIYESNNVEYRLKKQILKGHPMYDKLIAAVHEIEKAACERSDMIISVSDDDHRFLRELIPGIDKEIVTIQNGVDFKTNDMDVSAVKRWFGDHPVILFVGSSHVPNIEALNHIIKKLAPRIKAYFVVIGSVCEAVNPFEVPDNVLLFGRLSEAQKNVLMQAADLAINPIVSGSGSNLKLADYMMSKLPVITTSFGARGFAVTSGVHAIVCDLDDFEQRIKALLNDDDLRNSIATAGYEYVSKHLSWNTLAAKLSGILSQKTGSETGKKRKKLLAITYRFTDPPLGGAETYFLNVVRELDAIGDFAIDVVTTNIHDIFNRFHFSCRYTLDASVPKMPFRNTNILKFDVNPLNDKKALKNSREIYSVWMQESIKTSFRYLDEYGEPLLMGGWYYPEWNNNKPEVWSNEEAVVFLGDDVSEVTLTGFSPKKRKLIMTGDNRFVHEKTVSGYFSMVLPLDGSRTLSLKTDPFYADQDPRALGVKISSIELKKTGGEIQSVRLDRDYKAYVKERNYPDYIETLIGNALSRDPWVDERFQQTRGPVSRAMESWLEQHAREYDVILGHSIPFHTTITAAEFGKRHGVPVILLPHFHIDDEFYHWRSYYEALTTASKVIAAPQQSIPLFYDKIGASAIDLPGGAVDESEFSAAPVAPFDPLDPFDTPFVLVLGRKSTAKNYQWVVEAVDKLNESGERCKLVIIGKDEDQIPIDSPHAVYLGELPRHQVLAALQACKMLISMSESESFGIVLLEAWMMRKPVIVNEKCSAYMELVEHGVNGLASNRDQLPENIKTLLDDDQLCAALGANGYKKVAGRYTWRAVGREINEWLHRVANGQDGEIEDGEIAEHE